MTELQQAAKAIIDQHTVASTSVPVYMVLDLSKALEAEQPQAVEPTGLRDVVAAVCEGWTLPEGARKMLESALWNNTAPPAETQQVAQPTWQAERIDDYEIRVTSPEGESWRLRSADRNDSFNNFIWRWAESLVNKGVV